MVEAIMVVPCYNEAHRLDGAAFRRFAAQEPAVRFLFVDDGSRDGTGALLDALAAEAPERFRVLHLARNSGKAEAVRQGVLAALAERPAAFGYWDADLATPLEAIPEFCRRLSERPERTMVLGARVKLLGRDVRRRAARHYIGRGFATLVSLMLDLGIYDSSCGAKLFRATPETAALFEQPFLARWIFDVELLARFVRGRRGRPLPPPEQAIFELPLMAWQDQAGSKLRSRDFLWAFIDLARIYRRYFLRA